MKKNQKIGILALLLILIIGYPITAYAADPYALSGSESGSITVKSYSSHNDTWISYIDNGIKAWNGSTAPVEISISSPSNNSIQAARYDDSWYGLCTKSYDETTGYITKFAIQINARTIANAATSFSDFAESVIAHEFGHVFWLCDNPRTKLRTLMYSKRDRNVLKLPQTFDIDNVKAKYE